MSDSSSAGSPRPPAGAAVLLPWLVLLLACGDVGEEVRDGPADSPAARGGRAVVAVESDAASLLPPLARTALGGDLGAQLFPGLNRGAWREGRFVYREGDPLALARSWRFGPDSARLTYRLRDDLAWSDGEPLTAEDVVFTYRLLADPEAGLPLSYVTGRMDSVTAQGDTAVTFHFARRYPGMLFDTGVGVLPEHVYGELPPAEFVSRAGLPPEGTERAVVSGPFTLAEWRRGDRIVLVRNPAAAVSPLLDSVVVRILPEETTRLAELRRGGLDAARVTSFREAERLRADPELRLRRLRGRAYDYVAWNPDGHPAFAEPAVRQALSLAIDRPAILEALDMSAFAEPASGPYGPLFPDLAAAQPSPEHDPARARRLLAEAGYRELTFTLLVPAGSGRREAASQMIQAQLAEVGVTAELGTREFNALFERAVRGDYPAALLGWQVPLDPDISPFFRDSTSRLNLVDYEDARVRAAMDSALAAPTDAAARDHWRRAAALLARDHPYTFLWHFDLLLAVGPRLSDVETASTGFFHRLHRWRVRPDSL